MQYWLVQRTDEDHVRYLYFCNARGREAAKRMASKFLGGDSDQYTVTPISNPGQVTKLQINIEAT